MESSSSSYKDNDRNSIDLFEPSASWNVRRASSSSRRIEGTDVEILQKEGQSFGEREVINRWMAFDAPTDEKRRDLIEKGRGKESIQAEKVAERSAEWGVKLKTEIGEEKNSSETFREGSNRPSEESSEYPRVSQELKDALATLQQTFVVSDATKPDYPIMYASSGFFSMTGYSSKEIIGRNCRFLQGPDTDANEVAKIREAVRSGKSFCGRLLNYKKDGTPFWNMLTVTPIKDDNGKTIKFIGMQVEVSKYTEGSKEKSLRPNGLPKSLIRYDDRQKEKALNSVSEVVHTMKHRRPNKQDSSSELEMDKLNLDYIPPGSAETESEPTQTPQIDPIKKSRKSVGFSLMGSKRRSSVNIVKDENQKPEVLMTKDIERTNSWDREKSLKDIRQGIDLATTLERIEKNFVITDPRLPDNPIIFASDSFLELTEYTREEILGRNCRFLQGPETDQSTVQKIRDAIKEQREITVQLINYTKGGKKFWNLFHLQPMRDQKGELQYFIGVQLDGSDHVEPLRNRLSERTELKSAKLVKATAENVNEAVRELPDANSVRDQKTCGLCIPNLSSQGLTESIMLLGLQYKRLLQLEKKLDSTISHLYVLWDLVIPGVFIWWN